MYQNDVWTINSHLSQNTLTLCQSFSRVVGTFFRILPRIISIPRVPIAQSNVFPTSQLKISVPDCHLLLGNGSVPKFLFFFSGKTLIPEFPEHPLSPPQKKKIVYVPWVSSSLVVVGSERVKTNKQQNNNNNNPHILRAAAMFQTIYKIPHTPHPRKIPRPCAPVSRAPVDQSDLILRSRGRDLCSRSGRLV